MFDIFASRLRGYYLIVGVESLVFWVRRTQFIYIQSILHKAQSLNCRHACWLLDLTNFNLKMVHVPGKLLVALAIPDALSRCPNLPPDNDNEEVTLLPPSMFVQVIDTALSYHITSAFFNNPLVFQALQSMNENIPPAFHSCLSDWQVTEGVLTYKGHIYVPNDDNLCHTIPLHHHDHKTAGHPSSLKTCQLVVAESGGLAWPHISANMLKGVPPVNKTKQTHTQLYLPSP